MPKYWGKLVGENNGQLRFVRYHGWRTQARLNQLKPRNLKLKWAQVCILHGLAMSKGPIFFPKTKMYLN